MKTSDKESFFARLVKKSVILSALRRASEWFYQKLPESFIGHLFGAKERHSENGALSYLTEKIPLRRRVILPIKRFIARLFEGSVLLQGLRRFIAKLPALPLKCVGIFFFSFGAYTDVAYLIQRYATEATLTEGDFYIGLFLVIIGGLLTGSGKTCAEAIYESRLANLLLFSLLGIPKEAFHAKGTPRGRGNVAFLVGLGFGALTPLLSPSAVLLALTVAVFGYAVLILPEVGVILLFLLLPFLSAQHIALLCAFVTACWLLKLLRGKRLLATVSLDLAVLAFALLIFLGGRISVAGEESLTTAYRCLCLMMGYFLTVNMLRTSLWIKRALTALLLSLGVSAGFAVLSASANAFLNEAPRLALLSIVPSGIRSLLSDSGTFAAMMILLLPFLFLSMARTRGDSRFGFAFVAGLALLSLVAFSTSGGLIGVTVMIVCYLLFTSRHAIAKLICVLALLPLLVFLMPADVLRYLSSGFGAIGSSAAVSSGLERLLSDCFAGGIGLGEEALARVFPLYSSAPTEALHGSYGLYTHLILGVGITGLLFFAAILLIFFRHVFSYLGDRREDEADSCRIIAAAMSGLLGVLTTGLFTNVFAGDRLFLLFWLILGLASATVRTTLRERIPQHLEGPYLDIECKTTESHLRRKVR